MKVDFRAEEVKEGEWDVTRRGRTFRYGLDSEEAVIKAVRRKYGPGQSIRMMPMQGHDSIVQT